MNYQLAKLKLFGKRLVGYKSRIKYRNARILHDYQCIFVHIPKTAGNSVSHVLNQLPRESDNLSPKISKHAKAFEIKYLLGEELWEQYFSFAFVRNPWSLMVSCYHWWLQKAKDIKYHSGKAKQVAAMKDFNEFMQSKFGRKMINERYGNMFDWISENNKIIVDYVGKLETIEKDWEHICEQLKIKQMPLPHINKSKHRDYRKYYNDESIQIVAERFKKTIDLFDYSF